MSAPDYNYLALRITDGFVYGEVPFYGVTCNRQLSGVGDFSGKLRLGSNKYRTGDQFMIDATAPGNTMIFCIRNDQVIWGGFVWTRQYDSSTMELTVTAQTFESYFDHITVFTDMIYDNVEQLTAFVQLVNQVQGPPGSGTYIGLDPSFIATGGSGVNRSILLPSYERHFASEAISQLLGDNNSFDYTIDPTPLAMLESSFSNDRQQKIIRAEYPKIIGPNTMALDYPGSVLQYTWGEIGTYAGTTFHVLGGGSGPGMISWDIGNLDRLGYPPWARTESNPNLMTTADAQKYCEGMKTKYLMPVNVLTFTFRPEVIDDMHIFDRLGDNVEITIEDPRFLLTPTSSQGVLSDRITGWSLTTAGNDSAEVCSFTLEGQSLA